MTKKLSKALLTTVPISKIADNPLLIDKHTLHEDKVLSLSESLTDVGFFEGIHARKRGSKYELAFGHHRVAAARKAGMASVPLIVRDYTDWEMILLFSRENESSKSVGLDHHFEAWKAASALLESESAFDALVASHGPTIGEQRNRIIANSLAEHGESWLVKSEHPAHTGGKVLSQQALACAAAAEAGLRPAVFKKSSVNRAKQATAVVANAVRKIDKLVEHGEMTKADAKKAVSVIHSAVDTALNTEYEDELGNVGLLNRAEAASMVREAAEQIVPHAAPKRTLIDERFVSLSNQAESVMARCDELFSKGSEEVERITELLGAARFMQEQSDLRHVERAKRSLEKAIARAEALRNKLDQAASRGINTSTNKKGASVTRIRP